MCFVEHVHVLLTLRFKQFDTLGGFKRFSDVLAVGLTAGREALRKWKDEGILPTGLVDEIKGAVAIQRGARLRRMSI
jgi:lysophospholipid hydrolase